MTDRVNPILAAAKAHFRNLGTPSITVPEWTIEGNPVKIFWTPLTCLEREAIFDGGGKSDLDIFVLKALDADGKKLFDLDDKMALRTMVAPQIITRVAAQMMALPDVEDIEKN